MTTFKIINIYEYISLLDISDNSRSILGFVVSSDISKLQYTIKCYRKFNLEV